MEKEVLEILKSIQTDLKAVKDSQQRIEKKIDIIYEQTADLTEFRTDTKDKLDKLINVTKDNCFEIANLKVIK